jgi:CHAT domain-containing protein
MGKRVAIAVFAVAVIGAAFFIADRGLSGSRLSRAFEIRGSRPVDGRFSGASYVRRSLVTRGESNDGSSDAGYREQLNALIKSDDAHDQAIGAFLAGQTGAAEQRLNALLAHNPESPALWNDLSVILAARGRNDFESLCHALAAADHAIDLRPRDAEAKFNRAVILEEMGLAIEASGAYSAYLMFDGTSEWAQEAMERRGRLRAMPLRSRAWLDQLPVINAAAVKNDNERIGAVTRSFPQEARTWTETMFLGSWGAAWLARKNADAAVSLALAAAIGAALRQTNGDDLTTDAVAVIASAEGRGDSTALGRLAEGHTLYLQARRKYGARDIAGATADFARARTAFAGTASPMLLLIDYYSANAEIDRANHAAAAEALRSLDQRAPQRYRSLRAQIDWLRGTEYGSEGLLSDALASYERAGSAFVALGEGHNAVEMNDRAAALLTILGRNADAWKRRGLSFTTAAGSGDAIRLQATLYSAASDALREERWDVAHSLLTLTADIATGNPRIHAEASLWRALAARNAGFSGALNADLASARAMIDSLRDPEQREDTRNELRLVEALIARDAMPSRALMLFDEYVGAAEKRGRTTRLPQVLVERARTREAQGDRSAAETDLRSAIRIIEERRQSVAANTLRDSFLGKSSEAYDALAQLLARRGDTTSALLALDQRRARSILDRLNVPAAQLSAPALQRLMSQLGGTVVLSYGTSGIFAVSSRGIERFDANVAGKDLRESATDFVSAIQRGDDATARRRGQQLFQALIAPARPAVATAENLVIVADPEVQQIPFAALVDDHGSFLVNRYTISFAPSVLAIAQRAGEKRPRVDSVLAIGNPAFDVARYPTLPRLRGAEEEARHISSLYRNGSLLVGAQATKARVLHGLAQANVVHFATHAIGDTASAQASRFVLADDTLSTSEIAVLDCANIDTVVLAGCQTAVATKGYGDIRSLSAAFLAAGSRNVVASLWNINDDAVAALSEDFHRFLLESGSAAVALRNAQLASLRSARSEHRHLAAWASLQLYGYGN